MSKRKRTTDDQRVVSLETITSPDYGELGRILPAFGDAYRHVQELQRQRNTHFSECVTQEFTVTLCQAILKYYFQLSITPIPDRLCPPIPNRYFFCIWLDRILRSQVPLLNYQENSQWMGLDIGTGAYAIYSLLWSHYNPLIRFYATDIDESSVQWADQHVQLNHLQDRIQTRLVPSTTMPGPLASSLAALPPGERIDVAMVNPPFYSPGDDIDKANRTVTTANEGFYPNGEVGFVLDMLRDAILMQWRDTTFTLPRVMACMCGKKSSFVRLRHILCQVLGRSHVQSTEFGPGHHTRWFLAWTLERPALDSPLAQLPSRQIHVAECSLQETRQRLVEFWDPKLYQVTAHNENTVTVQEWKPDLSWPSDASLPEQILEILPSIQERCTHLLPGSHAYLRCTLMQQTRDTTISLDSFAHSDLGKRLVEKWAQQLPGELNRTNRKWRRLQKHGPMHD